MATQTFTVTNHQGTQERYEPRRVNYNGVSGRIWKRWVLTNGFWVFDGQLFQHIKASRSQIVDAWRSDNNSEDFEMYD